MNRTENNGDVDAAVDQLLKLQSDEYEHEEPKGSQPPPPLPKPTHNNQIHSSQQQSVNPFEVNQSSLLSSEAAPMPTPSVDQATQNTLQERKWRKKIPDDFLRVPGSKWKKHIKKKNSEYEKQLKNDEALALQLSAGVDMNALDETRTKIKGDKSRKRNANDIVGRGGQQQRQHRGADDEDYDEEDVGGDDELDKIAQKMKEGFEEAKKSMWSGFDALRTKVKSASAYISTAAKKSASSANQSKNDPKKKPLLESRMSGDNGNNGKNNNDGDDNSAPMIPMEDIPPSSTSNAQSSQNIL